MKINKYKIITASILLGLSGISTVTHAAWEVNDAGLRTDMKQLLSGINNTLESGNNLSNLQLKQQEMNQQIGDARFRRALGDMRTIDDDLAYMPTAEKCVEVTRARGIFGRGPSGGGSSGGSPRSSTAVGAAGAMSSIGQQFNIQQEVTRTQNAAVQQIVKNKSSLGTCVGTMQINGCSGDGTHPGADTNMISLFANVDTTQAKNVPTVNAGSDGQTKVLTPANVSIDAKGVKIATSLMQRLIGFLPEKLTNEQAKEASSYQAMWEIINARSSIVSLASANILGWRASGPISGNLKTYWDAKSSQYETYFPDFKRPEEPSQYELLRLMTMDMNEEAMKSGEDNSPAAIAARALTLNNILTLKSLEKQDYIMALLATQVGHQLNPIDRTLMQQERQRFSSDKNVR